jgi:hypothetical protein
MQGRPQVRNSARPGFLGPSAQPFRPDISGLFRRVLEPGMQNELKRLGQDHSVSLTLNPRLTAGRIDDRQALLASLDRLRRDADRSGMMEAMDQFDRQAVGILLSGALARALDLTTEDPLILQRYTAPSSSSGRQSTTSEGPDSIRKFLLARRLIEAGVRYVSVSISDFDTHSDNFPRMRNLLPIVDHGLHALITDLEERGMLNDVTIVVWGEFGRTPRIDPKSGGRHHWPQAGPALLAGGGLKTGQVIGSTDRLGDDVASRPVTYKDIFATLYRCLGIDARTVTLPDPQGRPSSCWMTASLSAKCDTAVIHFAPSDNHNSIGAHQPDFCCPRIMPARVNAAHCNPARLQKNLTGLSVQYFQIHVLCQTSIRVLRSPVASLSQHHKICGVTSDPLYAAVIAGLDPQQLPSDSVEATKQAVVNFQCSPPGGPAEFYTNPPRPSIPIPGCWRNGRFRAAPKPPAAAPTVFST